MQQEQPRLLRQIDSLRQSATFDLVVAFLFRLIRFS